MAEGRGGARIVRAAGARRMPWRNGGGETVEIAAHPESAGLDAFGWRVSLARIARDGPFSAFPGVDRVFTVIDGDGVELDLGAGATVRLAPGADPLAFPGEVPCRCRLLGGPVTALNAMAARGRFACAVARLGPRQGPLAWGDAARVVVCAEGAVATGLGTVGRHDAVVVPAGASLRLGPGAGARAAVVAFRPVAAAR